jgi:hypothetical protein
VTPDNEATDSPRAEWYAIALVIGVLAYLRLSVGRPIVGVVATTGFLVLVLALVRSALYRRFATYGAGGYGETLAGVARHVTVPLLLAFPVAVAATGEWRGAFSGRPPTTDLWIGSMAYLLALLELTQLRCWALNTTVRLPTQTRGNAALDGSRRTGEPSGSGE